MNEDIIEGYDTFNGKGCPYEVLFSNFFDQPIPPGYYVLLFCTPEAAIKLYQSDTDLLNNLVAQLMHLSKQS